MAVTFWDKAVQTPEYPSYSLKRAKKGDKTYELISRVPLKVKKVDAIEGDYLKDADLRYKLDVTENLRYRVDVMNKCNESAKYRELQMIFCKSNILYWLNTFGWTYDPRLDSPYIPFVTFKFQDELIEWVLDIVETASTGVVEKSRDMGASWCAMAVCTWLMLFTDRFTGYILSMTESDVDSRTESSLFGKIRMLINGCPEWMRGGWAENAQGYDLKKLIRVPNTSGTVEGKLTGGTAGRSGRGKLVIYDEFAFVEDSARVRQAGASLARASIFMSTANGMGNEFYDMVEDENIPKLTLHWSKHPLKNESWMFVEVVKSTKESFAREHDINYAESTYGKVYKEFKSVILKKNDWCHIQEGLNFEYDPTFDVYVGLDFGIGDPTSAIFAQKKPPLEKYMEVVKYMWVIFKEFESADMVVWKWVDYLKDLGFVYKDIVGDYRTGNQRDATGKTWIRYLAEEGFDIKGKYNTEAAPIIEVRKLLETPGAFAVNRDCVNTIKAFQNWSYPLEKGTRIVKRNVGPKHDRWSHGMKALAYLIDYEETGLEVESKNISREDWAFKTLRDLKAYKCQ